MSVFVVWGKEASKEGDAEDKTGKERMRIKMKEERMENNFYKEHRGELNVGTIFFS